MEKMGALRTIFWAACFRSSRFAAISHNQLRHHLASRSLFTVASPSASTTPKRIPCNFRSPFAMSVGRVRSFSEDVSRFPDLKDPEILNVFKDLIATNWDELPNVVVSDAKKALSKKTVDKADQEILKNVFCAAEAVEEFGGRITTQKMELDDSIGMSGEDVKPLPEEHVNSIHTFYQRYAAYLDSFFGPEEDYLRKKVETELGSKMIYLKMRCGGLGTEWWGRVTVLGTSGLAGSYIEQRA